jgi:hypothetical protein
MIKIKKHLIECYYYYYYYYYYYLSLSHFFEKNNKTSFPEFQIKKIFLLKKE